MGALEDVENDRPPARTSSAAGAIADLVVYHGTERGGFDKPRPGSFFTVSRAEALAYCEITDAESDVSLRYEAVDAVRHVISIPDRVSWLDSWPDYFDYVGEPNVLAANGNTGRLFFWDGGLNPVGDKSIVILSGVVAVESGEVVFRATCDDEAITPRVLVRRLFVVRLDIRNPIHLPWQEANLLGYRLGATPEKVAEAIAAWRAAGYDGVETLSDDGAIRGRKVRQFIPFSSEQIAVLGIENPDATTAENVSPLPSATGASGTARRVK